MLSCSPPCNAFVRCRLSVVLCSTVLCHSTFVFSDSSTRPLRKSDSASLWDERLLEFRLYCEDPTSGVLTLGPFPVSCSQASGCLSPFIRLTCGPFTVTTTISRSSYVSRSASAERRYRVQSHPDHVSSTLSCCHGILNETPMLYFTAT